MLASLAKLVDNLPKEKIFLLEKYFEKLGHSPEKVSITPTHTSTHSKNSEKLAFPHEHCGKIV